MTGTKNRKKALLVLSVIGAALLAFILLMYIINVHVSGDGVDQSIVDKKAREVFFWKDFPLTLMPCSSDVHEWPYATFQHHRLYGAFYYIIPINLLLMGDAGSAVIAIGDDHKAHFLPDEYNEMIKDENIHVESGEKALQAADLYVNSTCVYGMGMIVYNESDIPGLSPADRAYPENISDNYPYDKLSRYNRSNTQYEQLAKIVKPSAIAMDNGEYVAEFSTWKSLAGVVESWKVRVEKDGGITVIDRRETNRWIGDCFGLG